MSVQACTRWIYFIHVLCADRGVGEPVANPFCGSYRISVTTSEQSPTRIFYIFLFTQVLRSNLGLKVDMSINQQVGVSERKDEGAFMNG